MKNMLFGDEVSSALFRWERAFEMAIRTIHDFGAHWPECNLRARERTPPEPTTKCSCGFFAAKEALNRAAPR